MNQDDSMLTQLDPFFDTTTVNSSIAYCVFQQMMFSSHPDYHPVSALYCDQTQQGYLDGISSYQHKRKEVPENIRKAEMKLDAFLKLALEVGENALGQNKENRSSNKGNVTQHQPLVSQPAKFNQKDCFKDLIGHQCEGIDSNPPKMNPRVRFNETDYLKDLIGQGDEMEVESNPPKVDNSSFSKKPYHKQNRNTYSSFSSRKQNARQQNLDEDSEMEEPPSAFVSAKYQLSKNNAMKRQSGGPENNSYKSNNVKKSRGGFVPPARINEPSSSHPSTGNSSGGGFRADKAIKVALESGKNEQYDDPRLRGLDPALIERIESEVLQIGQPVNFDDIAGLKFAKENIEEIVVWPIRNPEYYTGLRQLPKGLLLFGPPGTGKTLIARAIASEVEATFFSISASSLTSKWIGEGEKTVRALFGVAAARQPSVVFIDEIDSLLCQRSSDENEASRRIKTEFLVQLDGAATKSDEMVLVIGATNRPQELDEAVRRRFVKRLYIPLPDPVTRLALLQKLLCKNDHVLTVDEVDKVCSLTKGYSGADVTNLAREASMGPLRDKMRHGSELPALRPIQYHDFSIALRSIRASVGQDELTGYIAWNNEFGTQEYLEEDLQT